jgi:hypothetical protein
MGPPFCKAPAVPRKRPVPITPPILRNAVRKCFRSIEPCLPDHSDVPRLKLSLQLTLFVNMLSAIGISILVINIDIGRLVAILLKVGHDCRRREGEGEK